MPRGTPWPKEMRTRAIDLHGKHIPIARIAELVGVPVATIRTWAWRKRRYISLHKPMKWEIDDR